ncbi:hypothetical protein ACF0H5_000242 [Mactra antiquata]
MAQCPEKLMATKRDNADSMRDSKTDRESEQAIIKPGEMTSHINLPSPNNVKREFQTENVESEPQTYAPPDKMKSGCITQNMSKLTVGDSQNKDQKQTSSKLIAMNTTKSIPHAQNFEKDSEHIGNPPLEEESNNIKSSLPLSVLVMNANGKGDERGTVRDRRRQKIQSIVDENKPHLVFFQEFVLTDIGNKKWHDYRLPIQYTYIGHEESSVMYDSRRLTEVDPHRAKELDTTVRNLQSNQNNRLQTPFPIDFDPISRMCARVLSTATRPSLELICISWHGPSNGTGGGRMGNSDKVTYFQHLMEFFRNIREKFKLPILVAGDFNVDMNQIEQFIKNPFKLCKYEGSERRKRLGIIDFCIFTDDLEMGQTDWINLNANPALGEPNRIFDHDPITTSVTFSVT